MPISPAAIRLTLALWRYRDRLPHGRVVVTFPHSHVPSQQRRRTHMASQSHGLVVGSAAAFRWNPGNIAVGILHVAGFAVDAVLGVDHEFGTTSLLHPFIDTGRTITI